MLGHGDYTVKNQLCQNRERTGVPARAARVGWWLRPDHGIKLRVDPIATAPGSDAYASDAQTAQAKTL